MITDYNSLNKIGTHEFTHTKKINGKNKWSLTVKMSNNKCKSNDRIRILASIIVVI